MPASSPTSPPPSPGSAPSLSAPAGPLPWRELYALALDEPNERPFLLRLLACWCAARGASAAALYLLPADQAEVLHLEAGYGDDLFPDEIAAPFEGWASFGLPGEARLVYRRGESIADASEADDPWWLLLAAAAKSFRLKRQLKEQQFQAQFRGVELEALYDVGLAVASTLDLEQLSEEILLRAVSLLDARRGALYLIADGVYRPERTFGGAAGPGFQADSPALAGLFSGEAPALAGLLPGARHLLAVPIEIEGDPRGILVVGDRESRKGVGPFLPNDRRTLSLFANQAAIALENARLHRQALDKERLERELVLAAEIQRRLLPKAAPEVPGYQLAGWNRSARQVGGDFYDLRPLSAGGIAVILGDVSGKGMPAALMVSTLHSALRLLLDRTALGGGLLERLNHHIVESSTANKFITLFLAELEPEAGVLHYFNAGHNAGLLLRRDGAVEQLGSGGVPLGLIPVARFQAQSAAVLPGDLVCLYSDGITEAVAPSDEEFGMDRLAACLAAHRDRPLPEIIAALDREVTAFAEGQPQLDDQTVVLVRRELG